MKRFFILLLLLSSLVTTQDKQYQRYDNRREAVAKAEQAVLLNPDSAEAHFKLAEIYKEHFNFININKDKILEEYKKAIELDAGYAQAYCGLGFFYFTWGSKSDSKEAFNKALSLKPDYAEAYVGLGVIHLEWPNRKREELKLAREAFEKAVRINPALQGAYAGVGEACYRMELYNEALEAFKQAVLFHPEDYLSRARLGKIYIQFGNKDAAMREYQALRRMEGVENIANSLLDEIRVRLEGKKPRRSQYTNTNSSRR